MKLLNHPLEKIEWMGEAREALRQSRAYLVVNGSADSHKLHLMNALSEGEEAVLILTYSERRAREIYDEYLFYDKEILFFST